MPTEEELSKESNRDDPGKKTEIDNGEKTFTQAEVDEIVQNRVKRATAGFADYDDLKKKVEDFETKESENMTELEKLRKDIDDLGKKFTQSEASRLVAEREKLIVSEATKLNFADPLDAVNFISAHTEADQIAGELTKLAESKPYLLKGEQKKSASNVKIVSTNPANVKSVGNQETREERRSRIFGIGGQNQVFNEESAKARGGGVIWSPGSKEEIEKGVSSSDDSD